MKQALVFSLDDNYIVPFKVFFYSLLKTESLPAKISIYIVHSHSLSAASRSEVETFAWGYGHTIHYIDIDAYLPSCLPHNSWDHVSLSTYFRLFLADILPPSVDYAVYLDADMLAVRSVRNIFEIECTSLLAAVDHCAPDEGIRLWGPQGGSYFQAGVLIIPLNAWRQAKLVSSCLEVIDKQTSQIQWWDQDVLNIVIGERWQRLPIWYNLCQESLRYVSADQVATHGILIHFSGRYKPWNSFMPSAYTSDWDQAFLETFGSPFDRASFDPSRLNRIKRLVRHPFRKLFGTT